MKKCKLLLIITFLMLSKISYCDFIPIGSHSITKCIKITNIDDYPEVSLIGFILGSFNYYSSYVVAPSECLKFQTECSLHLYAVKKTSIIGMDIEKIDWRNKDINALISNIYIDPYKFLVDDSIPYYSIEQYYKILGFTDTTVVLFKWKEITNDKDGNPLSENELTYNGDLSKLSQQISSGINSIPYHSTFTLFPNPVKQIVSLKINNFYQGSVPVEIISFGGKLLQTFTLNKTGFIDDSTIPIDNLPKGIYLVNIRFGAMTETQKLIIN